MSNNVATLARRTIIDSAVCLLTIAGGILLFGAAVYRVFISPNLAGTEAVDLLWPFFVAGAVAVVLGWWLDRAQG